MDTTVLADLPMPPMPPMPSTGWRLAGPEPQFRFRARGLQARWWQGRHLRRGADRSRRPLLAPWMLHLNWLAGRRCWARPAAAVRGSPPQCSISWSCAGSRWLGPHGGHRHSHRQPYLADPERRTGRRSPGSRPVAREAAGVSSTWPHPNKLGELLFGHPGAGAPKKSQRKTKNGNWSTDAAPCSKRTRGRSPLFAALVAGCTATFEQAQKHLCAIAAARPW